eukprot:TRINITY_DN10830_c0_g1_i1.p1 TRINITY_DN10830_c0_g1~~TRINITY_DN10830_c0_g1_i1.p1  ORF type:complete len:282 (-),score=26.50 TRINITY_DN10830_c0_g1_i1:31-876(-)
MNSLMAITIAISISMATSCLTQLDCNNNGDCVNDKCDCYGGFSGTDCTGDVDCSSYSSCDLCLSSGCSYCYGDSIIDGWADQVEFQCVNSSATVCVSDHLITECTCDNDVVSANSGICSSFECSTCSDPNFYSAKFNNTTTLVFTILGLFFSLFGNISFFALSCGILTTHGNIFGKAESLGDSDGDEIYPNPCYYLTGICVNGIKSGVMFYIIYSSNPEYCLLWGSINFSYILAFFFMGMCYIPGHNMTSLFASISYGVPVLIMIATEIVIVVTFTTYLAS